jgi:spore cortex biosynthesis protein YabQ
MLFYTVGQSQIFLMMLYAGAAVGLWYDALRLVRYMLRAGRALAFALDIVFGVGSAALVIAFMLKANYVELRLYALLGALCGLVLYAFTISPVVLLVYQHVKKWVVRAASALAKARWLKKLLK